MNIGLIEKFRALADAMQKDIDYKRRPMTQNMTHKRRREYDSRRWDADELERTQKALRALADGYERGDLPACLTALRSKTEIAALVYKGLESNRHGDHVPASEYQDKSPAGVALQQLIEARRTAADGAREQAEEIRRMEEKLRFANIDGFFPTPSPVIERMLALANLPRQAVVLEPSAGKGDIAEAVRARYPEAAVTCIERFGPLCDILRAKRLRVLQDDFLSQNPHPQTPFDRVLMNPPFENSQDAQHVMHAFRFLKPGGRLVAVMSAGPFFRQDRMANEFRAWMLEHHGHFEDLPPDAFQGPQAFRQTGVQCKLIAVNRPLTKPADAFAAELAAVKSVFPLDRDFERDPAPKARPTVADALRPSTLYPDCPF